MRIFSLGFAAPGLVPQALLKELDSPVLLELLEQLLAYDDHFALIGAFELCAHISSGSGF